MLTTVVEVSPVPVYQHQTLVAWVCVALVFIAFAMLGVGIYRLIF